MHLPRAGLPEDLAALRQRRQLRGFQVHPSAWLKPYRQQGKQARQPSQVKGRIEKQMRFFATEPRVDFDITFHWEDWGKGVLRLGHFTLLPEAFSPHQLTLATTNGGGPEHYALAGRTIDHGAAVSFLVSSSHGLGLTEGWAEIGDEKTRLRIEVDRATAPLMGLLTHRPAKRADGSSDLFCQLQLSALELDDTRKPSNYRDGPRRFRFSIYTV